MQIVDYFVYRLADGALLRRLSCPNTYKDLEANLAEGESAIQTGSIDGLPDTTHKVVNGELVAI